jgi:hypothetical protein
MTHLTEEQEMAAYYDELPPELRFHLQHCPECRARVDRLREVLDSLRDHPVPERSPSYGAEVWTRLLPVLPSRAPRSWWLRPWTLAPAIATLVVIAFLAGMLTQRHTQSGFSAQARERVLLIAMSDHLERSQIVLAQLLNSNPSDLDFSSERERARDLLSENRLLRETATHDGDAVHAALLDELERVLLDIANSPSEISPTGLVALQQRIEDQSLLFKVRITSADARRKGQLL